MRIFRGVTFNHNIPYLHSQANKLSVCLRGLSLAIRLTPPPLVLHFFFRSCKMRCFCDSKMDQGFFQVSSFQPTRKSRGICSRKGAHVWRGINRQARAGARQRTHARQERGPHRARVRNRCLRGARRAWWRTCSAIVQHHRVIRARPRVARA